MTDLQEELSVAYCNVTGEDLRVLLDAGIPDAALAPLLFGLAPIETHRGGLFDIAEAGDKAVILPCGEHDGLLWHLEDLVAFKLHQPERWWRRTSTADVLGVVNSFSVEPRRLYSTPLEWLLNAGCGLCVLDWARDPATLLMGAGHLKADPGLESKVLAAAASAASQSVRTLFHE